VEITREIATKVRDIVDAGLSEGVGRPIAGQMCVEAAVCFALGLPHGDDPKCVAQPLRRLKIRLNDAAWSSNEARAKGLRRLALAQLGSAGMLDERAFVRRVVDVTIRKAVPSGLRAAARVNPTHADRLEAAAVRCETEGTQQSCEEARDVAREAKRADAAAHAAAAAAAATAYAADAADAAYADAAAADAADVAPAYAADAAADAAAATAYAAYAADAAAATAAADAAAATAAAYAADAAATAAAYAAAYAAADAYADADADAAAARARDRAHAE
jgi:hypothetical protein